MPDNYSSPLTEEQRKQLKPALDNLDQALEKLDEQLTRFGRPGQDLGADFEGMKCLVPGCTCRAYKASGLRLKCGANGCGHFFTRHDVR